MKEDRPHILVVDDDERIRQLLERYLKAQDMIVMSAEDASKARQYLKEFDFDLTILDIMMPGESGLNLTRYIKDSSDIPVLLLTAKAEVEERIEGLTSGADDYLVKPFEPKELVLRIHAILRRTKATNKAQIKDVKTTSNEHIIGEWTYNADRKIIFKQTDDNHKITTSLTDTEIALLNTLLRRPNTPLRRDILAQQIGLDGQDRAIDVQITRLRKKMEPDPKSPIYIQTIRGQGYLLRLS